MKRLFIAADISDLAREMAAQYIDGLRGEFRDLRVGWERPEKLHITLKFLGDVVDERVRDIINLLRKTARGRQPFHLELARTGVFPSRRNPRIMWLGINDSSGELKKVAERIESGCAELGYKIEKRKFDPHVTIARLREPGRSMDLAEKHFRMNFEPVGFEVCEIVLYESNLQAAGSIYSKLTTVPLL